MPIDLEIFLRTKFFKTDRIQKYSTARVILSFPLTMFAGFERRLKNFLFFPGLRPDPLRFFYAYGILALVAMDSASYGLFRYLALGSNCSCRQVSFQGLLFLFASTNYSLSRDASFCKL